MGCLFSSVLVRNFSKCSGRMGYGMLGSDRCGHAPSIFLSCKDCLHCVSNALRMMSRGTSSDHILFWWMGVFTVCAGGRFRDITVCQVS